MIQRIPFLIILTCAQLSNAYADEPKVETKVEAKSKLDRALELLSATKTGASELAEAKRLGIPIVAGPVSRTDVTATRGYKGDEEKLSFETKVFIAQDKEIVFQALDLAHELMHATHPKGNPFDPNLNAADYVKHGIEGEGGEAQAIAAECNAAQEMIDSNDKGGSIRSDTIQVMKARCQFVWKTAENENKWKKSFYYLGSYYRNFFSRLAGLNIDKKEKAEWENRMEAKSPMFASAVAHKPYPLALLEEYVDITTRICEKAKSKGVSRAIASLDLMKGRCQAIGENLDQ